MGSILHVVDLLDGAGKPKVLKYCKDSSPVALQRFQREVRLMYDLRGSEHVMTIHHFNLSHMPPYFVMDFYEHGDLFNLASQIQSDVAAQEWVFLAMLDCVDALHTKGVFHRDIKPQNFLFDGTKLVISDLGLSAEIDSFTRFTRSSEAWGTLGYLPPEFMSGGFKNPDALGDVFMLGKSFYALLTGLEPLILQLDHPQIPRQLRPIIDRCCRPLKEQRYHSVDELRSSLRHAYDAINGRVIGPPSAFGLLTAITTRFSTRGDFTEDEVKQLIDELQSLDEEDAKQICFKIPGELFPFIAQQLPHEYHASFLKGYRVMVDTGDYGWSYAETIAKNMEAFFYNTEVSPANRTEALRIAIIGAYNMNRYAAMDTCQAMVMSIDEDELGQYVRDLIIEFRDTFIADTDQNACRSIAIRNALFSVKPSKQ
jgi:eukaryotic-like serine/threonine-protein kinase